LANRPLRCIVMGIPTSQNLDTPEGLEGRLSVGIRRIPAELPHLTEPELGKLRRTRMDSGRASTLDLLRGLPISQEVLRPLGTLNLTFFTLSARGSTVVFIGVRRCSGQRLGV
jgi:hypothetical protein